MNIQSIFSGEITSLGVVMDSKLTFEKHVSSICKNSFYHLKSLRHIRPSLTDDMSIAIAVAFVQSQLDYSNSLLFGTASYNINKLQHVQNLAARLALNNWHSSSKCLLDKLHWHQVHRLKGTNDLMIQSTETVNNQILSRQNFEFLPVEGRRVKKPQNTEILL